MLTQRPTSPPPPSRGAHRRPLLIALVLALLLTGGIGTLLATRGSDETPPQSAPPPTGPPTATAPPTSIDERAEVVARLREILKIRDRALEERDASLLDQIYTVDCGCLQDGRTVIRRLRQERLVWKELSTTFTESKLEQVGERQWIVVGTLMTSSAIVETETGKLVRRAPAQRFLFRFALAKPVGSDQWLLGNASQIRN